MRIFGFLIIVTFVFAACGSGSAYQKNVEILTSSRWMYDEDAIREAVKDMPLSSGEMNLLNGTLKRLENGQFEFQEGGTLILHLPGTTHEGVWELSRDNKELKMSLFGSSNTPNVIEEITEEKIVLAANKEQGMFFPKILTPAPSSENE